MLLLEPLDDVLERRVILKLEPIPQRPLRRSILVLLGRYRFRETEEGQGEVHEPVFVVIELVLAVYDLIREALVQNGMRYFAKKKKRTIGIGFTLYSSRQTRPTTRDVVVAIAGMIFPAICLVVWRSAGLML
jgi:hypothetical protein